MTEDKFSGFRHIKEVKEWLKRENIEEEKVCIAGSASMAIRGIRENEDVDIIFESDINIDRDNFPKYIDIVSNSFECVSFSDSQIIKDPALHDNVYGLKIIRPELVFSYKYYHKRDKDIQDINDLEKYALSNPKDWNWKLVKYEAKHRFEGNDNSDDGIASNVISGMKDLKYIGSFINKIREKIEKIYRNKYLYLLRLLKLSYRDFKLVYPVSRLLAEYLSRHGNIRKIALELLRIEREYLHQSSYRSKESFIENILSIDSVRKDFKVNISRQADVCGNMEISCAIFLRLSEVAVNVESGTSCIEDSYSEYDRYFNDNKIKNKQLEILRYYGLLFQAVLWPPMKNKFDNIEEDIELSDGVIVENSFNIRFSDDDFEKFLREIYANSSNPQWSVEKKLHRLSKYEKIVRCLELKLSESVYRGRHHESARNLKDRIRSKYKNGIDDYFADIIVHMGDNYSENRNLYKSISKYV